MEVNGDEVGFRDISGAEKSEGLGRSDLQSKTRLIFDFRFHFFLVTKSTHFRFSFDFLNFRSNFIGSIESQVIWYLLRR